MGKELVSLKEQVSLITRGPTAMMIQISHVDLLVPTDLLDLLIHLVCLRFEDHRGIQQSILNQQLLSLLKNLRGYPEERRTRYTSAHGQSTRIWAFGNLISSRARASLPPTATEPHGKPGYKQHSGKTLTSTL